MAHIPGLENVVAEALTRQYDEVEATAVVHSVVHSLSDIDLAEVAREQPRVEDESPSSLRLECIKFPGTEQPVVCDTSLGRPRVLIPEPKHRAIFDAVHNLAHPLGKVMLGIVARSYAWPNMRRDVLRWAAQCQSCRMCKTSRHAKPPVKPIAVPAERFQQVHVDIVGPFTSERGFRYILTMIDRTTRWTETVPLEDITAETVLQAFMMGWIARFGVPATVTSDRGTQFTSEAWRSALERLGIRVSTTTSYHPQANGMVERFHRALKEALHCAVRSSKSWVRSLPWVLLGLRNASRGDTSTSTAEVLYSTPLRVPGMCFQDAQPVRHSAKEQLELARSNAAAFLPNTLDLRRFRESPFVAKSLRTGFVFIRDDRLGKPSLAPHYTGPYEVKARNWENNTFTLKVGKKEESVSVARLKAANMPGEATIHLC